MYNIIKNTVIFYIYFIKNYFLHYKYKYAITLIGDVND